jgi:hypothetical protein
MKGGDNMGKELKTSPLVSNSTVIEINSINQSVNQYQMLGNIYAPGLVDEMLATNPTIQLGVLGLSAAMAQSQISLLKVNCKDEIYNFVYEMLFKSLNTRFQQVFLDSLNALFYGVAPAEISMDFKYGHWVITDIAARQVRGFDLYYLKKNPGEWWINGKYQWYDAQGSLKTVECGAPWEPEKATVFWPVFGPGLLGKSLLRPIVNEHLEKCQIRRLRGAALRKVLFGTPILHARKRDEQENALNPQDIEEAKHAVATAATGNSACLYLSDSFDEPKILYADSNGISKSIEAENAIDIQILMSLGSASIARGLLSGYGSQGAGENDQILQDNIRSFYFQWFAQAFQPLIDYIVDLNFGPQEYYPELSIVSPSAMTIPQLSRTLVQLVSAGLIQPTKQDEELLRRLCRLPEVNSELLSPENKPKDIKPLGITGHYDPVAGDTREERDIYYEETKSEK